MKKKIHNKGFAILVVLIAVVILLLLYFVQIDALFKPNRPNQSVKIEERPWLLEHLLIPQNQKIPLPRSPKPTLAKDIILTGPVKRNNSNRGTASVFFSSDGRIQARWESNYTSSGKSYVITAEMNGNISTKKTFQDQNGKDKSRLFFIAKGTYNKSTPTPETGIFSENGTAYLLGWLQTDSCGFGHITITQDNEWAAVYDINQLISR